MINSVAEYVAGEQYDLDDDTSDRFVVLGYATGDLSREFSDDERRALASDNQSVGV